MLVLPAMETATSKLTRKYQATVPSLVRRALGLKASDTIAFDVSKKRVFVRKALATDLAFAQALRGTLTEWDSKADDEAFRDL